MGMPGDFVQTDYAFYEEGTESGSAIIGTQNNQQSIDVDTNFQIRILMQEESATADDLELPFWEYELNSSATWVPVTTTSSVLKAVDSSSLTDADDTTSRLTGGSGTFLTTNSWVTEDGTLATLSYPAGSEHCEALLSCSIVSGDVGNGDQILVRLSADTPKPTFTLTADIDVVKAGGEARRRSNVT
jgi:hypothetical protein